MGSLSIRKIAITITTSTKTKPVDQSTIQSSITMRQQDLPIDTLPAWARLNGVSLSGVVFRRLQADDGTDKGCAVVATEARGDGDDHSHPEVLISVPSDMVLSLESVSNYAKSDRYLREVLEAVGDFGRVCP